MSISLLGLISNTVSIVVLRKSDGNEIFKKLLLTLSKAKLMCQGNKLLSTS